MNILRYIPMVTVMGVIFFLSSQPGDSLDLPKIPNLDKVLHAAAYGVLALTVLFAVSADRYRQNPRQLSLFVVLFCLLYGISDEFHQSFVPNRSPSYLDLVADTCGAAAAVTVWYWVRMRKPVT